MLIELYFKERAFSYVFKKNMNYVLNNDRKFLNKLYKNEIMNIFHKCFHTIESIMKYFQDWSPLP